MKCQKNRFPRAYLVDLLFRSTLLNYELNFTLSLGEILDTVIIADVLKIFVLNYFIKNFKIFINICIYIINFPPSTSYYIFTILCDLYPTHHFQ